MAIHAPQVTISEGSWSRDADSWLSQAVRFPYLAGLRTQVEQGIAKLFYFHAEGELCGAVVLRIDQCGDISEGVICAAAAELDGVDMTATIVPAIEKMFQGCAVVRFHTSVPAVAKKMARQGYQAEEIVSRKVIHG
jgi:hypothetical protein